MAAAATCPKCGDSCREIHYLKTGRWARCPSCQHSFRVEETSDDEPAAASSEGDGRRAPEDAPLVDRATVVLRRVKKALRDYGDMASAHDDVAGVMAVLSSIARELTIGHGARGEQLDYRALAAGLEFSPKLLERVGYPLFAREVTAVKEALEELAAEAPRATAEPREAKVGPEQDAAASSPSFDASTARQAPEPSSWGTGWWLIPLAAVAFAVVIALYWVRTTDQPQPAPAVAARAQPQVPRGTPAPTAAATAAAVQVDEVLPIISRARLALHEGDTAAAIEHLSAAAALDHRHSAVLETARRVVDALQGLAQDAVQAERWHEAEKHLTTARSIAFRFGIDPRDIEHALATLAATDWVCRVEPGDLERLRSLVGDRVEVELVTGRTARGLITHLSPVVLTLEAHEQVGGGDVVYTTPIPVDEIREVRYWLDH